MTKPLFTRGLIIIYKEFKKLDIKIPNYPVINGEQVKTENSPQNNSNGQNTLKKFNPLKQNGNAYQDNSEIPSYTCQNG